MHKEIFFFNFTPHRMQVDNILSARFTCMTCWISTLYSISLRGQREKKNWRKWPWFVNSYCPSIQM